MELLITDSDYRLESYIFRSCTLKIKTKLRTTTMMMMMMMALAILMVDKVWTLCSAAARVAQVVQAFKPGFEDFSNL